MKKRVFLKKSKNYVKNSVKKIKKEIENKSLNLFT